MGAPGRQLLDDSMQAIIICGMPASGKTTVANVLAKRLSLKVIGGGDILKEMAAERGYEMTGEDWWDTAQGLKFAHERASNPEFDREADDRLKDRIARGNVIVTSLTAPWLSDKGFKVWLNADPERRARRMAKRDGTEIEYSRTALSIRETENIKLYKRLYEIDFGKDMSPFDMVIDTGGVSPERIADLIMDGLKTKGFTIKK